jgi:hypothetical protein
MNWFHRANLVAAEYEPRASHADARCVQVGVNLWSKSFVNPIDNTIPVKARTKGSRPLPKGKTESLACHSD